MFPKPIFLVNLTINLRSTGNATASNHKSQILLTNMPITSRSSPNLFFVDLAMAFTKANITSSRVDNEALRSSLEKYTSRATPSESILRKKYMHEEYTLNKNSMKQEIANQSSISLSMKQETVEADLSEQI